MLLVPVSPVKSAIGITYVFQPSRTGVNAISDSELPPGPKFTNLTLNVVMFGVHTSIWKSVIPDASI